MYSLRLFLSTCILFSAIVTAVPLPSKHSVPKYLTIRKRADAAKATPALTSVLTIDLKRSAPAPTAAPSLPKDENELVGGTPWKRAEDNELVGGTPWKRAEDNELVGGTPWKRAEDNELVGGTPWKREVVVAEGARAAAES